jgi:hypothetical protein
LVIADEGEPAIRNGDAMDAAAEILQHLPTFPEAQQQRCIPEDNLSCPKSRRDPLRTPHVFQAVRLSRLVGARRRPNGMVAFGCHSFALRSGSELFSSSALILSLRHRRMSE